MDIEGHLLARSTPVVVAEAVYVLAVVLGIEGVIAVGYRLLKDLVLALRICDLSRDSVSCLARDICGAEKIRSQRT